MNICQSSVHSADNRWLSRAASFLVLKMCQAMMIGSPKIVREFLKIVAQTPKGIGNYAFSPMNMSLKQLSCKYWNIFKNVWCQRNDCGVTKWFCWHGSREIIPNVFWGITYLRTVCYCNRRSNLKRKRCHYILIYSLYFRNKRSKSLKVVALRKIKHQKGFSLICFANTRWLSGATGLLVWGLCQRMPA